MSARREMTEAQASTVRELAVSVNGVDAAKDVTRRHAIVRALGPVSTNAALAALGMAHRKVRHLIEEHYIVATGEVLFTGDLPAVNRWLGLSDESEVQP